MHLEHYFGKQVFFSKNYERDLLKIHKYHNVIIVTPCLLFPNSFDLFLINVVANIFSNDTLYFNKKWVLIIKRGEAPSNLPVAALAAIG